MKNFKVAVLLTYTAVTGFDVAAETEEEALRIARARAKLLNQTLSLNGPVTVEPKVGIEWWQEADVPSDKRMGSSWPGTLKRA